LLMDCRALKKCV
jgi:hypothetical protein